MSHRPGPHTAARRPGAVLVVLVALVAGCTRSIPSATSPTSTTPAHRGSHPTLAWHTCKKTYQCASLSVPLDWSRPNGPEIDLALIRKPARKPNPIGSLLFNPGGPGEPGTTFLPQLLDSGNVPTQLADRFDLVSWDPRGTGDSAGIACLRDADFTEPDPLPYPPTAAERKAVVAKATRQQQRCIATDGHVIPHVGTIQTVHDLDAIRAATGDAKLNYVGFSYGTTIGLEYLRLYGRHVRAMVLDGVALPGTDPITTTKAQMTSFESNLDRFLDDCRSDPSCPFGNGDPRAALMTLLDHLATGARLPASYILPDESGVKHRRDGTLGYTEAVAGIAAALYNRSSWSILRSGLAAATNPTDPDGHTLLMLRDLLQGRQLDGTWNHSVEANAAITCADQHARAKSYFGDPARISTWSKELPVFGAFGAAGLPGCFGWPKPLQPLAALTPDALRQAPRVVVVNSAHDPATPYANAVKAVSMLPDARLVTWGGDDHTSFAGGHSCIDDAVVPYLIDGTLPPVGVRCAAGTD
ncbi:MAG: alpha/beta fold hydrolase [Actinobacteria bacterium]|nr:alpha/beta fold hydrolase [Actinomycetota bacterium]